MRNKNKNVIMGLFVLSQWEKCWTGSEQNSGKRLGERHFASLFSNCGFL